MWAPECDCHNCSCWLVEQTRSLLLHQSPIVWEERVEQCWFSCCSEKFSSICALSSTHYHLYCCKQRGTHVYGYWRMGCLYCTLIWFFLGGGGRDDESWRHSSLVFLVFYCGRLVLDMISGGWWALSQAWDVWGWWNQPSTVLFVVEKIIRPKTLLGVWFKWKGTFWFAYKFEGVGSSLSAGQEDCFECTLPLCIWLCFFFLAWNWLTGILTCNIKKTCKTKKSIYFFPKTFYYSSPIKYRKYKHKWRLHNNLDVHKPTMNRNVVAKIR